MKRPNLYTFDLSASLLSAFDIQGEALFLGAAELEPKGKNQDINKLIDDQKKLEEDFKRACENSD